MQVICQTGALFYPYISTTYKAHLYYKTLTLHYIGARVLYSGAFSHNLLIYNHILFSQFTLVVRTQLMLDYTIQLC